MSNGVESGGPSEEDLKIRPGEPEGRVQNIDDAHDRANASTGLRAEAAKKYAESEQRLKTASRNDELGPYGIRHSSSDALVDSANKLNAEGRKLVGQAREIEEHGKK